MIRAFIQITVVPMFTASIRTSPRSKSCDVLQLVFRVSDVAECPLPFPGPPTSHCNGHNESYGSYPDSS